MHGHTVAIVNNPVVNVGVWVSFQASVNFVFCSADRSTCIVENGREDERQRNELGAPTVPQVGDDGGLHYDSCERERTAAKNREVKEVGLTGAN